MLCAVHKGSFQVKLTIVTVASVELVVRALATYYVRSRLHPILTKLFAVKQILFVNNIMKRPTIVIKKNTFYI